MGMELQPDDIEVGMLITGLSGPIMDREVGGGLFGYGGGTAQVIRQEDTSFQGKVYKVLAINLPYLAVEQQGKPFMGKTWRTSLDTRKYKIARVSPEFADALKDESTL